MDSEKKRTKKSDFGRKVGRKKSEFRQYIHLPRKLVKPINTLFEGRKYGFVHIISLTKSALYTIMR